MESGKFSISKVIPKKLKLSDYELGQTLGTGMHIPKIRFFR
jgi:hypothetical protein